MSRVTSHLPTLDIIITIRWRPTALLAAERSVAAMAEPLQFGILVGEVGFGIRYLQLIVYVYGY